MSSKRPWQSLRLILLHRQPLAQYQLLCPLPFASSYQFNLGPPHLPARLCGLHSNPCPAFYLCPPESTHQDIESQGCWFIHPSFVYCNEQIKYLCCKLFNGFWQRTNKLTLCTNLPLLWCILNTQFVRYTYNVPQTCLYINEILIHVQWNTQI